MNTPVKANSFMVKENGVKIVTADMFPIYIPNHGKSQKGQEVVAYYVCGFWDNLDQYCKKGNSPYVTIFKTQLEAEAFCSKKVIRFEEHYAVSEQAVNELIAENARLQQDHSQSITDMFNQLAERRAELSKNI